jgi:hypothetical protein
MYAWEIVVTMRKVSVMCVAVYFYESPPVQGMCVCVCVREREFFPTHTVSLPLGRLSLTTVKFIDPDFKL